MPRPAVVIQADAFLTDHPSVLVCHLTGDEENNTGTLYRVPVVPTEKNGLRASSILLVDRVSTIRKANLGKVVGRLEDETLARLDLALALFQGLA